MKTDSFETEIIKRPYNGRAVDTSRPLLGDGVQGDVDKLCLSKDDKRRYQHRSRSLAHPPARLLSRAHKIICTRKMLLRRKKGGLCAVWLTIMAAASNIKALESARAVVGILRA
jgi:hypothetical protein